MIAEPPLRQFFSYFTQDLVHEHGTADGAIAQYAKDVQDPAAIAGLLAGIAALLAEDDAALAATLARLSPHYTAWSSSARAWLAHVVEQVQREHAAQRVVVAEVAASWRVDIYVDGATREVEEADALAEIAAGGATAAALRDEWQLEGAVHIGDATIEDTLESVMQRVCFEGAAALAGGAGFEYAYAGVRRQARFTVDGATVALAGDDAPRVAPMFFARDALVRALFACGERWIAALEALGRIDNVGHLRPVAESARAALAAAGLA